MGIPYATREQIKRSLEVNATAYADWLIDQKLEAGSRIVEAFLHRRFYPELRTIKLDYPNYSYSPAWTFELGANEIISLSSLVSGGITIPIGNIFLRRDDDIDEPPYSRIEIDLSTSSAFSAGTTFQRDTVATGLFSGDRDTDTSIPRAILGGNINNLVTSIVLNPASGLFDIGVGSLLLIGTERMLVVERRMSDTGQNLVTNMAQSQDDVIVDVADGTQFAVGETILLGPERMKIQDIAANNLIVERAFDGSILAAQTAPVDVFALRTCNVKRGILGSTAASHNLNDNVYVHQYPGPVNELCIAETVILLEGNAAAYKKGDMDIEDIRNNAMTAYGRDKLRHGAI